MLPVPQDEPSSIGEIRGGTEIAPGVSIDFGFPVALVRLRRNEVLGAPVPETPVDEHCDPSSGEDDVYPPSLVVGDREINAVPKTMSMEQATDKQLGLRVTTSIGAHRQSRCI